MAEVLVVNVTRLNRYFTVANGFPPLKNTGKVRLFREMKSESSV